MATPREDKLVQEIRFNEQYAHLFYSEYIPEKYEADSLPTIKKKTLFTQDYLKRIVSDGLVEGGMLPPNCRYIEELENGHMVVVEEPPAYRTIQTELSMEKELFRLKNDGKLEMYGLQDWSKQNSTRPYSFTLAFPYVIFIFYISKYNEVHEGQIYLRTQQLSGMSDYLLKTPATNIGDSQRICFGQHIRGQQKSFTAAIQHAIMTWWSAIFNSDYTYNYHAYSDVPILNSYIEWAYMSQVNPMFIYNADWIKMDSTIGQQIENTKRYLHVKSKRTLAYKELAEMFYSPQETGESMPPTPRSKTKVKLFYDIAQGTYLDPSTDLNVGDSFETKNGKMAFVDSFLGFADGSPVKYIQIDIEGRKSLLKFNDKSCKYLAKQIIKQRRADEVVLQNGVCIKPEDIIAMKIGSSEAYRKVDYIRKSRGMEGDDILEVKIGNNYYLSSNLDATIFNIDSPEIDGVKLNKKDQYIIIGDVTHSGGTTNGFRMHYRSIDISGQNLVAKFLNAHPELKTHDRTVSLSSSSGRRVIYHIDEVKKLSGVFRVGRKLHIIADTKLNPKPDVSWGVNGILVHEANYAMTQLKGTHTKRLIQKDRFFVEGPDFDTEFVIGDKVVVANWENPLDVLTVKMLQGFKYNESTGDIHFILIDKEGKLSECKYVDGYRGIISTGKIRKVTNQVEELSAGMKIQATSAGIPCFPKKDINIIVAFIIDTNKEPLVLCSNGCTLWYTDVVEYFKKTKLKSKQWPELDHVPMDLSKIKFQAGDIINGQKDYKTSFGYLLYGPSTTRALRAMPAEYIGRYPESYSLDKYMTRECRLDCIPAPRVISAKIEEVGILRGLLDLHSYDVYENQLSTRYLNQRRA
jgi:hypothetical protein